jgi:hypothetical protein
LKSHVGYKKKQNFMLISKMQIYLRDEMPPPPEKVKIKKTKKCDLAKLQNGFSILT